MYPFCIYIYITYAHLYFSQDCHVPYDNHPSSASFPFCGARIFSPAVNGTIATPPLFRGSSALLLRSVSFSFEKLFFRLLFFFFFHGCSDARMLGTTPCRFRLLLRSIFLPLLSFSPPFFLCFFLRHVQNGGGGLVPSSPLSPVPVPPKGQIT